VQAARSTISSNVTGQVASILVKDNQRVHRGDVLFQLDDASFRIAVEEATAKIASAGLQMDAGRAAYQQQLALINSAEDNLALQQKEFERIAELRKSGIATASQFDQAEHTLVAARQQVVSLQQQAASVKALLGNFPSRSEHPMILQLQAELDRAQLNLSYTTIRAPDDGIVTKVEQLQIGDTISAGAPVFALISTRDVWVEANFKEDQLTYMRTGQPATVEVDTYRGRELKAHVASLSPGTGSQFAVLPAENATGNWVKVVQRLPVRLELDTTDGDLPLHTGLSATVEVDTGHRRHLFAPSGSR
jgi:membrane fusion protein (multidrug efflux system)